MRNPFPPLSLLATMMAIPLICPASPIRKISLEKVSGEGVWVSPFPGDNSEPDQPVIIKAWFDHQLLGNENSYLKRATEFSSAQRTQLRAQAVNTLKKASIQSHKNARLQLDALLESQTISNLKEHWIINGFTCLSTISSINSIKKIPGVKKIFLSPTRNTSARKGNRNPAQHIQVPGVAFDPGLHKHPWYIRSLLADKTWEEFKVTGSGTLNIIHDNNFTFPESLVQNLYFNPSEKYGNHIDDDGNGLIDDCHGYNFRLNSPLLNTRTSANLDASTLHGTMCAAIVCGRGSKTSPYGFGIAPEGKWAGVIADHDIEPVVEWAVEQQADTYSMSFSIPGLGEMRSHWRKIMEHGSFCGVYFVSGAGNFAMSEEIPKQMRTPEDIPEAVFAAAGVQRDLARTIFSSQGPVEWNTEHYSQGKVEKPEVCAFNHNLPLLLPDGRVISSAISGNSFAGPMFCGAIALMLSADPELLPWQLKEIITGTATDIGPPGIDNETGHGLINCYRAVKEVLRRKSLREGKSALAYTGRIKGDEIDLKKTRENLQKKILVFSKLKENGTAMKAGIKQGDLLIEANGTPVTSVSEFQKILRTPEKKETILIIERGGRRHSLRLPKGPPGIARMQQSFSSPAFD